MMRVTGGLRAVLVAGVVLGVAAWLPAAGAGVRVSASPGWRIARYFGACQSDGVRSVTATGPRDAWATGQAFRFQCDRPGLLIARWDGRTWRELTPPPGFAGLRNDAVGTAVAALSASQAWAFVDRANASSPPDSFALLWRGGRWRIFRLPGDVRVSSAAVFSPSNAWAFGLIGGIGRYAARFNGKRWTRVPIPIRPDDAAFTGPRDIWAVGKLPTAGAPIALAHWTGRWHIITLPPGIAPPSGFINDPWVLPDGSGGAWVALTVQTSIGAEPNIGGALLHWTGSQWLTIKVPFPTLGLGPLSRDGHGGLWIASSASTASFGCPSCNVSAMYHDNAGTWSTAPIQLPGPTVTAMRLIPGTASIWASGASAPLPGGQGDTVGVMLKYGP